MKLYKIVSGGQDGVDQLALKAASEAGFKIGGYIAENDQDFIKSLDNPNYQPIPVSKATADKVDDATVSHYYPEINESDLKNRIARTGLNVLNADATLILISKDAPLEGGTRATADFCEIHNRPLFIARLPDTKCGAEPSYLDQAKDIKEWLNDLNVGVLNIAGPRKKNNDGDVDYFIEQFLQYLFQEASNEPRTLIDQLAEKYQPFNEVSAETLSDSLDQVYAARAAFISTANQTLGLVLAACTALGFALTGVATAKAITVLVVVNLAGIGIVAMIFKSTTWVKQKLRAGYDLYTSACLHSAVLHRKARVKPSHLWLELSEEYAMTPATFKPRQTHAGFDDYYIAELTGPKKGRIAKKQKEFNAVWRARGRNLYILYFSAFGFLKTYALLVILSGFFYLSILGLPHLVYLFKLMNAPYSH
ncbi:YpsA SLOG family protein [Algisphaera agarilytica]|uniref:Molybdenum carrier n=1 Tax=Algisphaera agarilytica TaxID=1385975 RepID=A0A7X0H6E2_9BACT|nr:putative molybdenum carrier protein [Algisphaera agarilytica]MBB6428946.1 hypothetical protein [Algisphaera agarilytica]